MSTEEKSTSIEGNSNEGTTDLKVRSARLVNLINLLCYEIKVSAPAAVWMLPLTGIAGLVLLVDVQEEVSERIEYIALFSEAIFPLVIMLIANSLVLREREENSLAFVTVRSKLTVLWLRRLGALLAFYLICLGILLIIYHIFYLPLQVGQMLFASLATSLILIGLSSAISLLLKEMNTGYLVGSLWWAMCLIGSRTAYVVFGPYLYLFYFWFTARESLGTETWLYNKLALTGLGLVLIVISTLLLRRTERFFT
ncbi:hypothetical protein B5M50_05620 [candidate division KSB1 bacterium 4484_219]|nr:MAG: hypothetical protein B5M50_05620 [candidate division KSB1 bacterium 4484_219]HEY61545.1 hypothetical protein [Anaerolineae bacterium]